MVWHFISFVVFDVYKLLPVVKKNSPRRGSPSHPPAPLGKLHFLSQEVWGEQAAVVTSFRNLRIKMQETRKPKVRRCAGDQWWCKKLNVNHNSNQNQDAIGQWNTTRLVFTNSLTPRIQAGQNIYESCLSGEKQILCGSLTALHCKHSDTGYLNGPKLRQGACWAKVAPHCVACGEEISGTMAPWFLWFWGILRGISFI